MIKEPVVHPIDRENEARISNLFSSNLSLSEIINPHVKYAIFDVHFYRLSRWSLILTYTNTVVPERRRGDGIGSKYWNFVLEFWGKK